VTLELTEGHSGDVFDGLLNERIDVAVADAPTHPHAELTYVQLWVDSLWLVGAAGSIFGKYPKGSFLRVEHLPDFPIIMPSQRYAIRVAVDTAFDRQHLRFKPVLEANGALMILQLVKSGFGYSLMPSKRVQPLEAGGEFETIAVRPHIRRTMSVISRSALTGDPRLIPLQDIMQKLVSENVAGSELLPSLLSIRRPRS
jgi:DNA-binding transcriptional LysR family regulator